MAWSALRPAPWEPKAEVFVGAIFSFPFSLSPYIACATSYGRDPLQQLTYRCAKRAPGTRYPWWANELHRWDMLCNQLPECQDGWRASFSREICQEFWGPEEKRRGRSGTPCRTGQGERAASPWASAPYSRDGLLLPTHSSSVTVVYVVFV